MKKIVYIGNRDLKEDNVAQTGLIWTRGQVHEVTDEKKAAMLLAHPDVWADADKEYQLKPAAAEPAPSLPTMPTLQVVPQGGEKATPFWEPVTFAIPVETYEKIRDKELEVVFMTPDDAEQFKAWKAKRALELQQAERMRAAKAKKEAEKGLEKTA